MLTALAARLNGAIARSWLVGDTMRDIDAARAAGLAGAILLAEEEAVAAAEDGPDAAGFEMLVAATVADAVSLLRRRGLIGATE